MDFKLVNGELKKEVLRAIVIEEIEQFEAGYDYWGEKLQPTENPSLWRYMDFTKFLSLLDSSRLFFSKPKNFEDPYEGSFSISDLEEIFYQPNSPIWSDGYSLKQLISKVLEHSAVMCWHINEYESDAMWKLYLSSLEGVAIKTSYNSLLRSIELEEPNFKIFSGEVQYADYSKDRVGSCILETLFYKRNSFSHEKEFRLIAIEDPVEGENNINSYMTHEGYIIEGATEFESDFGTSIKSDLEILIEEIYISPSSPGWFVDLVKSILKKYELDSIKVTPSNLNSHNLY